MTFQMPAEWQPHDCTWMGWPARDYTDDPAENLRAFSAWAEVANTIVRFEPVKMLVEAEDLATAKAFLDERVELIVASLDDGWLRDTGPSFVKNSAGELAGVNWVFNGWGNTKWAIWSKDQHVARQITGFAGVTRVDSELINEGGLGHMAVKFAAALGADVSVIGRSPQKLEDAKSFGASAYIDSSAPDFFESYANTFDIVLNTTSSNLNVDQILSMLRVGGSLVNVGLPGSDEHFNPFSLIASMKSISGSNTGGIQETQEMLNFCAEHKIAATIEVVDASDAASIDAAYDRMLKSDVRYRFVIDAATI